MKLTTETYNALVHLYHHFNANLFDNKLPEVVFIYHRQNKVMGYASFQRWQTKNKKIVDEIAINPEYLERFPIIEICQTLVHEMVHIWQMNFGTPGRRGYHNKEWSAKMASLGLIPSSSGKPGGSKTGENMMDYVRFNGLFHLACKDLVRFKFSFPLVDRYSVFRRDDPILAFDEHDEPIQLSNSFFPIIETEEPLLALKKEQPDEVAISLNSVNDGVGTNENTSASPFPQISVSTLPKSSSGRVKYVCPTCQIQVWGKPALKLGCLDCKTELREQH